MHLLSGCIYFPRREANVNRVEAGCTCRRLVGNIRPYPSSDSHKQGKGRNWKSESHIYIKSLITYEEGATYMSCRTCEVSTRSRHFSLHLGSPHTDQNLTATLVTAVSWFQRLFSGQSYPLSAILLSKRPGGDLTHGRVHIVRKIRQTHSNPLQHIDSIFLYFCRDHRWV